MSRSLWLQDLIEAEGQPTVFSLLNGDAVDQVIVEAVDVAGDDIVILLHSINSDKKIRLSCDDIYRLAYVDYFLLDDIVEDRKGKRWQKESSDVWEDAHGNKKESEDMEYPLHVIVRGGRLRYGSWSAVQ